MTDVRDATDNLLADRPDLEDDLQTVLDVDAKHETWTYDDVPLDSGAFGELVSRGVAEKTNGEYRLADREAVRAALKGEEPATATSAPWFDLSLNLPPRRVSLALLGALVLVAAFRLIVFQSVFRAEHVVLLGNDPYYYRYWLFRFVEQGTNIFGLPEGANVGEPLLLATLLAATKLLDGTINAANLVLAWYPVATALVTALLVYVLAAELTDDRRIGLTAVALLAVTPAHAYRTSIGFADHHAFDFFWLALTAVAAVSLLHRSTGESPPWSSLFRDPIALVWITALGIGVAAQVLSWNAGPILLLPLAVYGVVRTAAAVKADRSPLADLPLITGILIGGSLALAAHLALGWQYLYIVVTPLLLAAGMGTVVTVGELARRRGLSGKMTLGGVIAVGGVVFTVAYVALPEFAAQFTQEIVRLFGGGVGENIAETASLFSPRYGTIVGPFFFFGLSLFFALPYLAWGLFVGWSKHQPAWLIVGSYGGILFVLALLQVRFAGHLALFVAVFAGLALVHLLAITDATERPAVLSEDQDVHPWRTTEEEAPAFSLPDRQTVIAIAFIFLLVGGLGAVMTPLRTNLLTVSDESYNAATFMEDYSERQGWEYPQNYVFSEWGDNRMYNAFVNGESRSYAFAQENYEGFLTSTNSSGWYQQLRNRAGFVVVDSYSKLENTSRDNLYNNLQNQWGSGTGHYRAIWASSDGSKKVYALVPGATVTGPAKPGSTVTLTQTLNISGQQVEYTRTVQVNDFGVFTTRLPNPGTVTVNESYLSVNEHAVTKGQVISAFSGPGVGYWSFDEGRGKMAFDRVGGHHAELHGSGWTSAGINESALQLNGSGYAQAGLGSQARFTVSIWVKPDKLNTTARNDFRNLVAGQRGSLLILEQNGAVTFRVPGVTSEPMTAGDVETGEWSHVVAVYNGTHRILYIDGEQVASQRIESNEVDWGTWIRVGGAKDDKQPHGFDGSVDELRVYGSALTESDIKTIYGQRDT